jgi:hypothetical protein
MFWKINTHLFAAKLALDDAIDDGMVTIPPFGSFPVAATALRALKAAPAAYRAGVLGPDLFPDMYVGGWSIHSDLSQSEGWIADNWLRHVWSKAHSWPNQQQRDRVMAFAYGYLTHAAGDMFAHTYVSRKADGAWVTGPDFPKRPHSTAIKHIVLEGYIGSRTPLTDMSLDVWPRFVAEVLIKDPAVRPRMFRATHYDTWLKIYDWLGPQIERAKQQMNNNIRDDAPYWMKCGANPVPCAKKEQMESWRLDIDRGMRALVDANQTLGEKIMEGQTREGIGAINDWASEWVPKMFGAHAIGEGTAALNEFLAWVNDALAPINEAIMAEVMRFFEQQFPAYYKLYEAIQDPAYWIDTCAPQMRQIDACFPPDARNTIDQDMHIQAAGNLLNWREFEPLYNTVILSKLALLDGDGLNQLVARAGVAGQLFKPGEETNIMLGVVRSMTQSYQWVGDTIDADSVAPRWPPPHTIGPTKHGVCGPEHEDTIPHRALCGIKQRNYAQHGGPPAAATAVSREGEPVGGFALWGHPEAREKIFRVIFKGYGAGPGMSLPTQVATEFGPLSNRGHGSRTVAAVAEQLERMSEIVGVMRGKISGAVTASAAPTATPAPKLPTAVRLPGRRLPEQQQPAQTPAKTQPPAAALPAQADIITNWGERCCAKDIAELRASLKMIQAASAQLRSSTALTRLRRPALDELGVRNAELAAAIDGFASARDAQSAATALTTIGSAIHALARLIT